MRKALLLTTFLLFSASVYAEDIKIYFPRGSGKLVVLFARKKREGNKSIITKGSNQELDEDGSVFSTSSSINLKRPLTGEFCFGIKDGKMPQFNYCKDSRGCKILVPDATKKIKIDAYWETKKDPNFYYVYFEDANNKAITKGFVYKK